MPESSLIACPLTFITFVLALTPGSVAPADTPVRPAGGGQARLRTIALGAILALGALLRVWGNDYGLPNTGVRPDEEQVIGAADAWLRDGEWPSRRANYPDLPMHVDAVLLWAAGRAGEQLGALEGWDDFLARGPALQYRIGRFASATFGVATILVTFLLGRTLTKHHVGGLLSALILSTLYLHVRDSHFATVDVTAGFFTTLTVLLSMRAAESDERRPWLWAGVAAGLAAGSKYNAAAVFASVLAAGIFRVADGTSRSLAARRVAASALAMATIFVCASPSTFIRWSDTLNAARITEQRLYGAPGELALFVHLRNTLPVGFGEVVCVAAVLGAIRGLRRRPVFLLLAFVVPTAVSAASVREVFPRYLVTLAPPAAVLAADASVALVGMRAPWLAMAAVALAAPGFVRSVAFDRLAARPDTRQLVADWVQKRYQPGTRILLCYGWGRPVLDLRTRVVDCRQTDLPLDWAHVIITPSHPFLARWDPVSPELLAFLGQHARRVAEFDPFRPQSPRRPYFHAADAFYLPFSGLSAMERGGPRLAVWELKPPLLRGHRKRG